MSYMQNIETADKKIARLQGPVLRRFERREEFNRLSARSQVSVSLLMTDEERERLSEATIRESKVRSVARLRT